MVRSIAPLVYYDRVDGTYIKIGTGSWLHWLAHKESFKYESFWGSFIACKEQQGEETFWIAYRRVKEQQRCANLGLSEDLTVENLLDTAKKLSASNMKPWEGKHSTLNLYETLDNQSETIPKSHRDECGSSVVHFLYTPRWTRGVFGCLLGQGTSFYSPAKSLSARFTV
jgi:hypothetical protein